ncbi:hypothetical protein BU23DRAFT_548223 [Bimuria novae-zelandiae CBS 107.79]|uniref:Uncharacterized protein n=1 Tax=Bimuria novae-zelandiae CBS 107.79 TaxID=1447943 RepID=A0A6A5VW84_9PLEO|nr:hypothetical protein BU23DRAFT_548223 [Bimuria novae-zelandiae CBS 107.79]
MSTNTFQPAISRADAKTEKATAAILTSSTDISALPLASHQGLLLGPKADIYVGPIRALIAWSPKATSYFQAYPTSTKIVLHPSTANIEAIRAVLRATVTYHGIGGAQLARVATGTTFATAVLTYQAGYALGMSERVQHVAKRLEYLISTTLLPYDDLTLFLSSVRRRMCCLDTTRRRWRGGGSVGRSLIWRRLRSG